MKQLSIFLIALSVFAISNAQISLNGPEGCDATYFYKAKDGYWLGTGSSGGVFFEKQLDNSWKSFNDPFGPAHIYWIGQISDTLITNADNTYYQFDKRYLKWVLLNDSILISRCRNEEVASKSIELKAIKNLLGKKTTLFLPRDVNTLHIYNRDSLIVCTQSGLYVLNINTSRLSVVKTNGVMASDVYQINKSEQLGVITLTQDHCIWSYNNSSWVKLFDLKETGYYQKYFASINLDTAKSNQIKIALISSFYPKGYFNINSDGSILLNTMNLLILIDPLSKSYKFIPSPANHSIMEAKVQIDGKIIAVGDFSYNRIGQFIYNKFTYDGKWNLGEEIVDNNLPSLPVINEKVHNIKNISLTGMSYSSIDNMTFQYPMPPPIINMVNKTVSLSKLKNTNYIGYYFNNIVNSKILSGCYDYMSQCLYLGTYGSGVIMIK